MDMSKAFDKVNHGCLLQKFHDDTNRYKQIKSQVDAAYLQADLLAG